MYRVGEEPEHSPRIPGIIGFSKDFAIQDDDGIGREHGDAGFPAPVENHLGLLARDAQGVFLSWFARPHGFVDVRGMDFEREPCRGQQFGAPRRRGSEDEGHKNVDSIGIRDAGRGIRSIRMPDPGSRIPNMIPVHDFSTSVLAQIIRRQPPSQARTNFAWQLAVGQAVARATTVALTEGVLTVRAVDRRWIREIDPLRATVLEKLQHVLGTEQVTRIDLR